MGATKAAILALLLLAHQGGNMVHLRERDDKIMVYQMIDDDSACEIRSYPPNHHPETIWRGSGCHDQMLTILRFSEGEGWRCDWPTRSRPSRRTRLDARQQGIEVDRLGEVVIGTDAHALVDGLLIGQGREK